MPSKIAVTGASGRLGRELVPLLLQQGHQVVCIDRLQPADERMGADDRMIDMRDYAVLIEAVRGCDALIHLAAHPSPNKHPDPIVYNDNSVISYNALCAAAALGIKRVCLASSVNALGGAFSQAPRYDYFPVDERHPTYADDPYGLSKWVLEQQADAFARRHPGMQIASLRLHWLMDSYEQAVDETDKSGGQAIRHLWSYTLREAACRASLLAITSDLGGGHEVFFITAPRTANPTPSLDLAREHYPMIEIRGDLSGHASFYDCSKAAQVLGWRHDAHSELA